MIANFFKKTKPIHAIFICILFLTFYIASIFFVEKPTFSLGLLIKKLGFLFIFLILFFLIRFINRKNQLSGQDSYVLLFLAFLFGLFPRTMIINEVFIAHFFLLFSFRRMYSMRSFQNVKQKVFDSGFWIGMATIFYIWSSVFLLLIFLSILVYKKQEIRNFLIAIVGFITPLFLAFTYYFLTDSHLVFLNTLKFEYNMSMDNFSSLQFLIPFSFVMLFAISAAVIVRLKINTLTNDLKPSWILLVIHLLIASFIVLMSPEKNGSEFIFLFFPIIIFSANIMQVISSKIIKEIIVYCFCLVVLSVYFLQFITIR